jgi:plastocyanin
VASLTSMTSRSPRRFAAIAVALVAVFAFGACSSSAKKEPAKTVTNGEITVEAFDIHFDVGDITTTAGPLKVTLVNKGALEHTFKVNGTDFELKAKGGETKTGTVTLQKGTYDYECAIPGHAQQGMKGTIKVS